jgi:uncharacterized protein (TIGR03435 family)
MRLAVSMIAAGVLHAQVSYVASVKPNRDATARTISEYFPGGRLAATAAPTILLLGLAYRVAPYLIVGAPDWVRSRRFDVQAKADGTPSPSQQELLQAILKDRFHLAAHRETREMPVFELVLARKDGRLGPQMTRSEFDCAAYRAGPHALPEPGRTPPCGMRVGPSALSGKAIAMAQLAASLGGLTERTTLDRTGLAGGYDVEMTWADDAAGPALVTAIVEQLGLRLVPSKAPVEVLVVDRIEEPSAEEGR